MIVKRVGGSSGKRGGRTSVTPGKSRGGVSKTRGGRRGGGRGTAPVKAGGRGRGRGGGRQGGDKKKLTAEQLDAEMDSYFLKDEKTAAQVCCCF